MANPLISVLDPMPPPTGTVYPTLFEHQVTQDPTCVRAELLLDLTSEPSPLGPALLTVEFPFTSNTVPAVVVQRMQPPSGTPLTLTFPAPATASTAITGYEIAWGETDAGGIRSVLISIHKLSATTAFEDWVVRIANIPPGGTTKITPGRNTSITRVEADPFIEALSVVPSAPFAGAMVTLSAKARRNTLPLPTAADYNPPTSTAPSPLLSWTQASGPTAPPGPTSIAAATFASPAADGYSASATFTIPASVGSATLGYTFTATFGDCSATSSVAFQVSGVADYWMLLVDRSGTMGQGTPIKRTNAVITARIWADVISAFHYSSTSPDRIGVMDFYDANPCGFRATGPATFNVVWPATAAMGSLKAITNPDQGNFTIGGAQTLGTPGDQTPLGDALIKALDLMAATSAGNQNFRYHMFVVTDGIENTGTVKVDAASPIGNAALAQTFDLIKSSGTRSIFTYTSTGNVRIYPVATGFSNTANATVANILGTYGHGPFWMSASTSDLFPNAFGTALFGALGAGQPNVVPAPPFNAPSSDPDLGANPGKFAYFGIPNGDTKLVVVVLWNNTANTNELDLGWRTGSTPGAFQSLIGSPAVTVANRDTHTVAIVDLTLLAGTATQSSEWRVSYRNAPGPGGAYQNLAVADVLAGRDLHVRTALTFDRAVYYNDEPIVLTASAHAGHTPIRDAKVEVEVDGPALSEGELLASNSRLAIPSGKPPTDQHGRPHPASREAFLGRVLASKELPAFPRARYSCLFADGGKRLPPDLDIGEGYYSNAFGKNWREGTYNFKVTISGKTPEGEPFSDVHAESRIVKLRTEDAFSKLSVAEGLAGSTPGLRSARIRVTPKDALGQRLGPYRAGDVEFQTTRGTFIGEIESEFDGSYSQILVYPEKQVPIVTAQVQGRAFTPIVLSRGLSGIVMSIVRAVSAWLVRYARHR